MRWLVDGETPALFTVVGEVTPNEENELRPFAGVSVSSLQLRPDRWSIDLTSQYGAVKRGQGYRQRWSFRHRDDEPIVIETERTWDGGWTTPRYSLDCWPAVWVGRWKTSPLLRSQRRKRFRRWTHRPGET